MPLSDHEERILAEIERRFYEEDPAFAHTVRSIARSARTGVRLPVVGMACGLALIIAFLARSTPVALIGFALFVASATILVQVLRARSGGTEPPTTRRRSARGRRPFRRG
jgi:hypothetical protein